MSSFPMNFLESAYLNVQVVPVFTQNSINNKLSKGHKSFENSSAFYLFDLIELNWYNRHKYKQYRYFIWL